MNLKQQTRIQREKEFVGGCDIITEMAMSGELDELLKKNKISYSSEAATKIREANKDQFFS